VKFKINIKYFKCVIIAFLWSTWNKNGPYSHLWPVWSYDIIVHNLINAQFSKKLLLYMCFEFPYKYIWKFSHSKKKLMKYDKKMYNCLHVKYLSVLLYIKGILIFWTVFRKNLNVKFHGYPSGGADFCQTADGRTEKCCEFKSHFS
jgi:hypothetical protein